MFLGLILVCGLGYAGVYADGPGDNVAMKVRPVPPPGKEIAKADREELEAGVRQLELKILAVRQDGLIPFCVRTQWPDAQIYCDAVRYPLMYGEQIDVKAAKQALADGMERAEQMTEGKMPWLRKSGPRGYLSKIDGSVQPYLLSMPDKIEAGHQGPYRLDFSCHGRGEDLTELKMIRGKASPTTDKFVVQLYGRYCNANKFAGEIDLLEAFEAVKKQYPIDENRVLITGFSMGGAACWQFAVHYTDLWAAAQPGAGFAETKEFLRIFQNEKVAPPWYEQKLWHVYDCTDYAANLANCPTIAYSGEIDTQKQAADIMAKAIAEEGMTLEHLIGPKTAHSYEKNTKIELDKRIDAIIAKGRNPVPQKIRFTTWTLRYNRMYWVTVDAMEKHWDRARVEAEIADGSTINVKTQNVAALTLNFPTGQLPFKAGVKPQITIDGTKLDGPADGEKLWTGHFAKTPAGWHVAPLIETNQLHKHHGLQGPIDDAFMDSFIIVRPTGKAMNEKVGAWTLSECDHAIAHWQKQFRGEARVKQDTELTDADIAASNIVLFGDPSSNKVLARIADKLPIRWTAEGVAVGDKTFPADHHAAVLIYPNPLNPNRYVVLNSGFTFREYDYLNNARQVPKLPDYAVIDLSVPVTPRGPGGVVKAGFFGEKWELLGDDGQGKP
jgi:dienelactone hydrolase